MRCYHRIAPTILLALLATSVAWGQPSLQLEQPSVAQTDERGWLAEPVPMPAVTPAPEAVEPPEISPRSSSLTGALQTPITAIDLRVGADPELLQELRDAPEGFAIRDESIDRFGEWSQPEREAAFVSPRFAATAYHFAAPAVYSRPLYFEQPNVERYGHHLAICRHDHLTQSAISAAHFFASVPVFPYKMGMDHSDDCSYVLGSYRPGSCNPHQLLKPECSLAGVGWQGYAVTGLVFLIP